MLDTNELLLVFKWIWKIFLVFLRYLIVTRAWILYVLMFLRDSFPSLSLFWYVCLFAASAFVGWCHVRWVIRKATKNDDWTLLQLRKSKVRGKGNSSKPQGFVFGKARGKWACRTECESDHILILGAPGTGKSQALALPSLAVWQGGELVVDVKGELWENVGRHRGFAKRFSITDKRAFGFDPFEPIRKGTMSKHDCCYQIAQQLIPENQNERDPYWSNAARNMLTATLLAGIAKGQSFIESVDAATMLGGRSLVHWIAEADNAQANTYNAMFLDMEDKQLSSVYSTMHARIAVFSVDENVRDCFIRANTVTGADLEAGASVYLCVEEAKLEQYKSITALIVAQFMRHFEQMENEGAKSKTLFLLDECPRLGKLDQLGNALATLRSKGVCVCVIGQSLAQFQTIYSREEAAAMVDMCAKIAVLSAKGETAEMLTKLVGDNIERMRNKGDSSQVFDPTHLGKNKGYSEQYQPIIRENEWAALGEDLVLVDSSPKAKQAYVRVRKMPFWKHRETYLQG